MPDYIATVQRVLTNYPKAVMDNVKLWSGNLDNIHIAIGDPEPYIITADDIMEAYNIAVAYFEEDFPSPETPLGSIVENFLVVVRTPATRTTPRTSASILTDSQLLKTPATDSHSLSQCVPVPVPVHSAKSPSRSWFNLGIVYPYPADSRQQLSLAE